MSNFLEINQNLVSLEREIASNKVKIVNLRNSLEQTNTQLAPVRAALRAGSSGESVHERRRNRNRRDDPALQQNFRLVQIHRIHSQFVCRDG
jgi:hypothetical protein